MSNPSYAFIRYNIVDENDRIIEANTHGDLIRQLENQHAPHRNPMQQPPDYDTFIMQVEVLNLSAEDVILFDIARHIKNRVEHRYNPNAKKLNMVSTNADDTQWTRVVLVPRLNIAGIRNGTGDNKFSARSGVARIKSVVRHITGGDFRHEEAGKPEDMDEAIKRLNLTDFNFTVIPFNPHPSNPGQKLHDLLEASSVGRLRGDAKPKGLTMEVENDGLLDDVIGMSQKGYGQYGFEGRTDSGAEIAYKKPTMHQDKQKNLAERRKPMEMRAHVQQGNASRREEENVVKAIVELYGP